MSRVQDIVISDASLKAEFITRFFNGEYSSAFDIINSNPQLDRKAFLANVMNEIANMLSLLQNNFQNEVINYLSTQLSNFQNIIDNYISKQEWDSTITYQIYNFVTYNNIVYLYINSAQSSGNIPTNTEYWLEVGLQGEKGEPGLGVSLKYIWNAETSYNALDIVSYGDSLWVAKVDNYNVPPGTEEFWQTLDGSIITFINDGTVNINSLSVTVEPVQDLHGYDSPWPAGGGKNLLQTTATSKTESGVTWTVNGDGSVTASGTATGYTDIVLGEAIVVGLSGTVTINGDVDYSKNVAFGYIRLYDSNEQLLATIYGGGTQTTHTADLTQYNNAYKIVVSLKRNNNVATSGTFHIQVVKGTTVPAWTPYSNICPISGWDSVNIMHSGADTSDPTTYTIQLGQTVYGGTLDVTNGMMTVEYKKFQITSFSGAFGAVTNGYAAYVYLSDTTNRLNSESDISMVSNIFKFEYKTRETAGLFTYGGSNGVAPTQTFILPSSITSVAEANAWLADNPIEATFKLAAPIPIQLDPVTIATISGQTNNVWADAGDVSVELTKSSWETFLNFKLIKIYSNQNAPTGDDLYNGVIWFEILNS